MIKFSNWKIQRGWFEMHLDENSVTNSIIGIANRLHKIVYQFLFIDLTFLDGIV